MRGSVTLPAPLPRNIRAPKRVGRNRLGCSMRDDFWAKRRANSTERRVATAPSQKKYHKVAASPSLQPRGGRDAGPRVQWQGDSGRRRRQDGPLGGTQAAADADVRLWRRVHAQGLRLPSPTQAQARCRIGPACAWCQRGGGTAIRRRRALPKELLHGGVRRAGRSVLGEGREGRAARGTGASRRQ